MREFLITSEYDWQFPLEPSTKYSMAYNNSAGAAGKLLGGTSAIDDMLYLRGNPTDYQSWGSEENPQWLYENIHPYFLKSEKNEHPPFFKRKKNKVHSQDGFLSVDYLNNGNNAIWAAKEAFRELNYEPITDFCGKIHQGYGNVQAYVKKGVRQSSGKAFLTPAKDRPNLHVIKNGLATQILFDDDDPDNIYKAIGVKFYVAGKRFRAFMKKEVIVSAGAIGSAQLLMLSGIGPQKSIRRLGVKGVQNLPVGDNLQDLAVVPLFIKFNTSTPLFKTDFLDQLFMYTSTKIGLFSNLGSMEFIAAINTTDQDANYPNVLFKHNSFVANDFRLDAMFRSIALKDQLEAQLRTVSDNFDTLVVNVVLLKPKSRGKIRLKSKTVTEPLKIEMNYLTGKHDMDVLMSGVRTYQKVLGTKAMLGMGAEIVQMKLDICDDFEYDSDSYWECYIRHFVTTSHHFVGTTKMGPVSSRKTVVDHTLRVKNTEGLRVVDASIMPEIVSGGTTAATLMIAEKGSDFIKETWQNK